MRALPPREELFKPSTCEGCDKRDLCKEKLLACRQFLYYVNSGRVVHGERLPTRELWQKIFIEDEDEL
jgi:hypothetical protein